MSTSALSALLYSALALPPTKRKLCRRGYETFSSRSSLSFSLFSFAPLSFRSCSSNVLPLSSLVIEPGKAVWVVYLDIVCLNYDGGILDAAVLASVGALKNREPLFHPLLPALSLLTVPISHSCRPSSNLRHRHAASSLRARFGDFARFADTTRRRTVQCHFRRLQRVRF